MNDWVFPVLRKKLFAQTYIGKVVPSIEARKPVNVSPQLTNLIIKVAFTLFMNKKIELVSLPIDRAIEIHDQSLSTPAVHCANNM